ncbi:MAG: 2-oxoacid:acceptor oxidoreductase subunit alpha [Desulfobacterota bacterium]|nr:2-oxoacid:acceptor oxidoreductase subunit alpha [Thermodesulfobacteriota bacterium]
MSIDITIKIGGEAGQGIQTVGQLLALTCREAGLYVFGINDFESRIRGGHSFFQLRISDQQVRAPHHVVNLLVALDERTVDLHRRQVSPDGMIIVNKKELCDSPNMLAISFDDLAAQAGDPITANTVAAGCVLAILHAPFDLFHQVLTNLFSGKKQSSLDVNLKAGRLGYDAAGDRRCSAALPWSAALQKKPLIEGSQAIAYGALAGDCRFAAFYPMSPATGIMIHLAACQNDFPLIVEQAEDEIAAANMIIGASFAGVRSMTATSGGGFCLMTEAIGLAGITETPCVFINAQRPGPATGLATRTAQADLHMVIRAGQDDFPRFVFAPGSPEQAYAVTSQALSLAEKYQVPAIVLVDQFFNDSLYTLEKAFLIPNTIERFVLDHASINNPAEYKRYVFTDSGISPRALPCQGTALVKYSGNEHLENGHTSEAPEIRTGMVDKRARKLIGMRSEMQGPEPYYADAETLLLCWGSTHGVVREAVKMLRQDGINVGSLHFCDLWPFPEEKVAPLLSGEKRLIVVEQNSTAQFAQLLRQQTGISVHGAVLKYNGRPLYPYEIVNALKEKEYSHA